MMTAKRERETDGARVSIIKLDHITQSKRRSWTSDTLKTSNVNRCFSFFLLFFSSLLRRFDRMDTRERDLVTKIKLLKAKED